MSPASREALAGRWRRLNAALAGARATDLHSRDAPLQDVAARSLHEVYDLWEIWRKDGQHAGWATQNAAVDGDSDGETAAALAAARGEKTHGFVEFGVIYGFGVGPFGHGPFGGGWHWQPETFPADQKQRGDWYAEHVAHRLLREPLDAAVRWLRAQPELQIPEAGPTPD